MVARPAADHTQREGEQRVSDDVSQEAVSLLSMACASDSLCICGMRARMASVRWAFV